MIEPQLLIISKITFIDFRKFSADFLRFILIVAQNIDCGYTLEPHRICFGSKISKQIGISKHTPVLLYKNRDEGGIQYMDMLSLCVITKHLI